LRRADRVLLSIQSVVVLLSLGAVAWLLVAVVRDPAEPATGFSHDMEGTPRGGRSC